MAKLAKDIARGAVLIAAINAIAVGYLVFSGQVADESSRLLDQLSRRAGELTLVALVLTIALVIALKAFSGRGTPLRGGWPSGHAASRSPAGWRSRSCSRHEHRFLVSSLRSSWRCSWRRRGSRRGPLDARGRSGGAARRARDARRLPGVLA
jgi:hypothetical protein